MVIMVSGCRGLGWTEGYRYPTERRQSPYDKYQALCLAFGVLTRIRLLNHIEVTCQQDASFAPRKVLLLFHFGPRQRF